MSSGWKGRNVFVAAGMAAVLLLTSAPSTVGDDGEPPPAPIGLVSQTVGSLLVLLSWLPSPTADEVTYYIYSVDPEGNAQKVDETGAYAYATVAGAALYFVTAVNDSGESGASNPTGGLFRCDPIHVFVYTDGSDPHVHLHPNCIG